MLQEPDGVHAKLLSIHCNIILGFFWGIIVKAFYYSFFISWLKEKKISLKLKVKEEAKKLKAILIFKKPICKNFQVK